MTGDPWLPRLLPVPERYPSPAHPDHLRAFLADQRRDWPRLAEATEGMARIQTRTLRVGGRTFVVQWNPGRVASSTARVDPGSVQRRPCFLCPDHQPPEERGFLYGEHLVVLPNPAPILPEHLVMAWRTHRDQALLPALHDLVDFAVAAGPTFTLLFNGPRCGASAPDHLHLQAGAAGHLPLEVTVRAALAPGCPTCPGPCPTSVPGRLLFSDDDLWAWHLSGHVPAAWLFQGTPDALKGALPAALQALGPVADGEEEPPFNVVAWADGVRVACILFPRGAHRPACWYAEGPARCVVSPGAVDVAGLVITPRREDFDKMDEDLLTAIFSEVSLPPERLAVAEAALPGLLATRWKAAR